jgi:UDP-N-acetylmuramate--alanine ligase
LNLRDIKKIYFVGIGGIGMSALARYFHGRGVEVHGYDRTETELTRTLAAEGMKIHFEEDVSKIPEGVDLVVFTPAVPESHQELRYFRERGFPVEKRSEVLGIISRSMKTAAVAGTHGKTTTSSMLAHLMRTGGIDCTAFLGGIARNFESNFLQGKSDWVVVEADEYDRSFLRLDPDQAVILSMDADHLDIYGDRESMLETGFRAFARKLKAGGQLWLRHDLTGYFHDLPVDKRSFGVGVGEYRAENIRVDKGFFLFDYHSPEVRLEGLRLAMPGRHNVENATAAVSVALTAGLSREAVREALASFKGIKRRFDIIYRDERVVYIDDYAHHPAELSAVIGAARQLFPGRKLTGIFQPHLYSRTRDFAGGFAEALDQLDETLLLDIYPAREAPIEGVDSAMILDRMRNPRRELVTKSGLLEALEKRKIDVLMTMGAGDIDAFVEPIKELLSQ